MFKTSDNSQLCIEIINKVRHNLMDAKCRWRSDRLDDTVSFREPLAWSNESNAILPGEDTKLPENP